MMLFAPCGWSTSVSHKKFSIVRLSLYYSRFCFASDIRKETAKEPSRGTPSPSPKPDNTAGHLALPRGEIMSRVKDYCLLSSSIFLASALLAKVYLSREDYQNVVKETSEVMQMGYKLWKNYADNFDVEKENGQESIFEIQYKRNTPGVSGSNYNGYYRPPFVNINGWVGYGDDPVTRNHYECYEEGDLRRDVNVRLYTKEEYPNMSSNYEFPCYVNKFQDPSPLAVRSQGGENNYPILRYSDVYLMRAEALNAINTSDAEAYECLNVIRRRAFGLNMNEASAIDIKLGLSKEDFLDIILLERRKEFAFEGQRRFDLVRTHKLKEAMMAQNPTIGAVVEEKHYLLPIPVTELDANKLLEQTPGW